MSNELRADSARKGAGGEAGADDEAIRMAKLAAAGRLAACLAHEINNPLQGIILNLDVLKGHVADGKERNLEYIVEGFNRISKIISQLLSIGKGAGRLKDVDVNAVLTDAFNLVRKQFEGRGCKIFLDLAPDLPPVRGEAGRLHHAFLNLLINAVENMPEGGVLTLSSALRGDQVRVDVTDTGRGIDEDDLPHVFEPLFSTRGKTGTGLGLFAANSIVADHGGAIEIKSRPEDGTRVRIALPIRRGDGRG